MRFGIWNVKSLYRAGSFTAAPRELARYKLDLAEDGSSESGMWRYELNRAGSG